MSASYPALYTTDARQMTEDEFSKFSVSLKLKLARMKRMFLDASKFNKIIGAWDTANARDMRYRFTNASKFNIAHIKNWVKKP